MTQKQLQMTKPPVPPVLAAIELLNQWFNYSCLTDYIADAQYPDIRERSEKVAKDLQAWVDEVPSVPLICDPLADWSNKVDLSFNESEELWEVLWSVVIKHLMKGIK